MANADSIWQRMGNLFRAEDSGPRPDSDSTTATMEPTHGPVTKAVPTLPASSDWSNVPWWRRRSVRQAQSREMALRMFELAGAMQQHFRRQDERARELSGALQHLGGVVEQMASFQQSQTESLKTVADQSTTANKHAAKLADQLSRVPDSLVTQADAIRAVARHLEISQEADTQLMHSLQQFGRAVDTLGSSGSAQVEVLQTLNNSQREQHDALTALVREQGRRFIWVMVLAALAVALGIGALAVAFGLSLAR